MTQSNRDHRSGALPELDDLTAIKGVTRSAQRWFRTSFSVRSYADLAALSRFDVEARAKKERRRFASGLLRNILSQAKRLAKVAASRRRQEASMVDRRQTEQHNPKRVEAEWEEFASFIIYFERKTRNGVEECRTSVEQRTAVHHLETSEQSPHWPGVAVDDACHWILSRLPKQSGVATEAEPDAPAGATPQVASKPVPSGGSPAVVFVDVDQVRFYQPLHEPMPQVVRAKDRVFPAFINANQPVGLEASFSLRRAGATASSSSAPMSCDVAFRARDLATAVVTSLGTATGQVAERGAMGTARLTVHSLPPGTYSLQVAVTVRDGHSGGGYSEVPFLQAI